MNDKLFIASNESWINKLLREHYRVWYRKSDTCICGERADCDIE